MMMAVFYRDQECENGTNQDADTVNSGMAGSRGQRSLFFGMK